MQSAMILALPMAMTMSNSKFFLFESFSPAADEILTGSLSAVCLSCLHPSMCSSENVCSDVDKN